MKNFLGLIDGVLSPAEKEKEKLKELFPHTIGDYEEAPVCSNVGKYGPYLTYRGENFKLPKESDPMKVTLDEAVAIITNAAKNKKTRGKKK